MSYGQMMIDTQRQYLTWVYYLEPQYIDSQNYYGTYVVHEDYGLYVMQGPVYYNYSTYYIGGSQQYFTSLSNVVMNGYLLFYGNYEGYLVTNTYASWFMNFDKDDTKAVYAFWYTYSYGAAWNDDGYSGQFSIYDTGSATGFYYADGWYDYVGWENETFEVHYDSTDLNVYYYVSLAGEYLYQYYMWY